jgi:hypothetical protein
MADEGTYSRRSGPRDRRLRAGDAERQAVADILRREHLAGRLDDDEFEARLTRCLAAKTYAELDELIGDLLPDEPQAARAMRSAGWRPWPLPLCFLPLLFAAIVLSHGRAAGLLFPLLILFAVRTFVWRGGGWRRYRPRETGREISAV